MARLRDMLNGEVNKGYGYVQGRGTTYLTPQGIFDENEQMISGPQQGGDFSGLHPVDFMGAKGFLQPDGRVVNAEGRQMGDLFGGEKQRAMIAQAQQLRDLQEWQLKQEEARARIAKLNAEAQREAKGVKPQAEWKYDAGSDTWVSAPNEEFPQGRITQPAGKVAAAKSMDYVIDQFDPALKETPQGGILGISGMIGKVTDSQKAKRFDNLREQLSTEIRTVYRIPGEGALSDREQAQYGVQLPSVTNDEATNRKILEDLRNRTRLRFSVGQGVETAPKSQQQSPAPTSGPKVGTIKNGYIFMGGDPANPTSWKQAK